METIDRKLLKEAAEKEGFGLESQVVTIFKRNYLTTQQDFALSDGADVDVLAYPQLNTNCTSIFITQCKGSNPNKPLLLFANSQEFIDKNIRIHQGQTFALLDILRYEKNIGFNYFSPNPVTDKIVMISKADSFSISMRYCYTGDFRTLIFKNTKPYAYDKEPRHDQKNNLFKGLKQVTKAIFLLDNRITEIINGYAASYVKILPLIVTNAQIYISDYPEKELVKVEWAICRVNTNLIENPVNVRYIFIVNINKLEEFIVKFG